MATATASKTADKVADAAEQAADDTRKITRTAAAEADKAQTRIANEFEAGTERAREINEQILGGVKKQSLAALDAYESALNSVLDFQKKMADASQLEWVTALTDAHVSFVTSVSGAYTQAARDILK